TESICEMIPLNSDTNIQIVDGFSLGGNLLLKIGKSYGPITRYSKFLWKLIWNVSSLKPNLLNKLVEMKIEKDFLNLTNSFKPDIIISVHPNFNGSVLNILEKHNMNITFITMIADLISIYPLWADKRADYIISPTIEAKKKCLNYGIDESKIKVLGFPVRSRFYKNINNLRTRKNKSFSSFNCLIMSGGEGVGNMNEITKCLLENFNCNVNIIAGKNKKLKMKLEKSLKNIYGDKVMIHGFINNIEEIMHNTDIAFTRGSPNVIMEAVSCNIPIIVMGALPGQEEGNPDYIKKYNLGILCDNINNLKQITKKLFANEGNMVKQIKKSQQKYFNPNAAKEISDFLLNLESTKDMSNELIYENNYTKYAKSNIV
ncbi:MAG: glycosyltransferase, partial [Clostridiales bacterium]